MKNEFFDKLKEHYYAETPKFWRSAGDALLYVSIALSGFIGFFSDAEMWIKGKLIFFLALAGGIGKFLTNFFKEKN